MHNCAGRVNGVFDFAPANVYQAYMASRKAPKIVHYAGTTSRGRIRGAISLRCTGAMRRRRRSWRRWSPR